MRLETIPIIIGVLFALAGIALVADAAIPDGALMRPDRRLRPRPKRHLAGEAMLGLGIVFVGIALLGRDSWRYTTLAILGAFFLCAVGVVLNWRYVRGMMMGDIEPGPDGPRRAAQPDPAAPATAPAQAAGPLASDLRPRR